MKEFIPRRDFMIVTPFEKGGNKSKICVEILNSKYGITIVFEVFG